MLTMANAALIKKKKMSSHWLQIISEFGGRRRRKKGKQEGREKDGQHTE